MRVTVQPETKRKHISESDRYCPNELVSFVPRANILKTDSFLTATIWTNDRNQPRCINVVCCVAYLLLTAHTGNPSVCVHVSVCLSRTLHTASCLRVTHKPFRPTLFPSSAPLHASYTFTSPAHVHTHTQTLLLIYSHTQKTSRTHFLSLRLQLAHLHPPISRPLGVLPVLLFEGDCCFLGGCGGESSSLKGRDRHTHSHEKTKGKICHVSVSLLYCQNCNLTL